MGAEAEVECGSFVADAAPDAGRSFERDSLTGPARLDSKRAAGSLLAGDAVTDRDADGVAVDGDAELAAGAGGDAGSHDERLYGCTGSGRDGRPCVDGAGPSILG